MTNYKKNWLVFSEFTDTTTTVSKSVIIIFMLAVKISNLTRIFEDYIFPVLVLAGL